MPEDNLEKISQIWLDVERPKILDKTLSSSSPRTLGIETQNSNRGYTELSSPGEGTCDWLRPD